MRVHLLYFGMLRDQFGVACEQVELPDQSTVGELLRILRLRTSNDARANEVSDAMGDNAGHNLDERLWRSLAVAVNREYALPDAVLRDGDEAALLPPVSGGCFAHGERLASLANVNWEIVNKRISKRVSHAG